MADFVGNFELAGVGTFVHDPSWWEGYYLGPEFQIEAMNGKRIAFAIAAGPLDGRAAELATEAINNFRAAGESLRTEITGYLYQYYLSIRNAFSEQDCIDYDIPLDVSEDNVWQHVGFPHAATVEPSLDDRNGLLHSGIAYIDVEGRCAWEEEHGLQLVFNHGQRVGKVSPYDGHPTNAHAASDPALLDVVFRG